MNSKTLKRTNLLVTLNLLFFIAMLVINYLGASGFFNGMSQAEVSAKYTTLITPAGFAFSIWGLIYTLLLITLIYFFIKRKDPVVSRLIHLISPLFIVSTFMNMGWIIAFSYEQIGISTLLILALVVALFLIIERIYKNRTELPVTLAGISFTLYAAWVFIASILNVSLFLVKQNWGGFGISDSIWTIVILFIAIAFVLYYLSLYKNAIFPISLAWAFYAIYSSYQSGKFDPPMASLIEGVLLFGMIVFIILVVVTFVRNGYSIFPRKDKLKSNDHIN